MPFCENCGQEVSDTSKFCSSCGEGIIISKKKAKQESIKAVENSIGSKEIDVETIWWVKAINLILKEIIKFILAVPIGALLSYLFQPSIIRDYYTIHYYISEWFKVGSSSLMPFQEITNSIDDFEVYVWTLSLTIIAVYGLFQFSDAIVQKISRKKLNIRK